VNIKTILKSSVAASALFAFAAPVSMTAMAADEFGTGSPTKLVMSGRITRAIWHADDGVNDKLFLTSGDDESRIRWIASGTLSDTVTAGATLEMSMPLSQSKSTATLHGGTTPNIGGSDGTDTAFAIRHEYLWVNHKTMGKLTLGQASVATDGVGNKSPTGTVYSRSGKTFGDGLTFIDTTGVSAVSTNTVGAVFSDLNTTRTDVIKYDSPTFAGFKAAISRDSSSKVQTALRYSGKFNAVSVTVGLGYLTGATTTNYTALGGMSATHDSGWNISYQTGKKAFTGNVGGGSTSGIPIDTNNLGGRDDAYFHGGQIGYKMPKLVSVGSTAFAVSIYNGQNMKENDGDAESWGIRMQQNFDALGARVSLGYSVYSYDAESEVTFGTEVDEDYDDIDVIALQTVFNF
jgi:hypothetical protein